MKVHEVDYGSGRAWIWHPDDMPARQAFSTMANSMFGIRKSITAPPQYFELELKDNDPPESPYPYDMALKHHGDAATFLRDGTKVHDEWDKVYGCPHLVLHGAHLITGRTDWRELAAELEALNKKNDEAYQARKEGAHA